MKVVSSFRLMCTRPGAKQGFTLIELVVAIGILAVLSVMATPYLQDWLVGYRLKGAARAVYSDLQWTKMRAISQKLQYKVAFINSTQYRIERGEAPSNSNWPGTIEGIVRDLSNRDSPYYYPNVTLNSNNDPIFQPRGTASPWATITLRSGDRIRKITVIGTGRISIQ